MTMKRKVKSDKRRRMLKRPWLSEMWAGRRRPRVEAELSVVIK